MRAYLVRLPSVLAPRSSTPTRLPARTRRVQLRLHPLASLLDRELGIIWIWLWLEGESESNLARMLLTALDLLELILLDLFELTLAFFAWRPTVAPPLLHLAVLA